MAPKSCDGEVNDGSSSDVNVMEPMETSTGVGLSFLGKRRAETPNPGESEQIADEDGEEYESVEDVVVEDDRIRGGRVSLSRQTVFLPSGVELVRSTILKRTLGKALPSRKVETIDLEDPDENDEEDPDENDEEDSESDSDSEWDKDSFDGREYHSSDDQREYATKDLEKRARFYKRTVIETKSSAEFPPYLWGGIATLRGLDEKMRTGVTGFNVKLDHVLRANFNPGGRTTYYITFAARESDSPDAPLVEYQAKVDWSAGKTYPILCRPTSPPKLVEVDGGAQLKKVSEEIIN
ncbi:Cystatin-related plant [Arabidopsis thaliana x Arabidopsis arenosa]|uniref:Cystatin-related plant n=1 Tax=Arabidopsis thaliana x Arabidopsis arenosa TaxID=1240361 RepID=A0A8T2EJI8_9BRAS|nr:Cystatin-related plant [Arabidopsis thaliana x Arabidopsis arenosa]